MGDEEVFNYKGVALLKYDLDTLKGPHFLTDEIIAFYFKYISSSDDILLLPPSGSILLANSKDDESMAKSYKLSTMRLVIFPVNDCDVSVEGDTGTHWSVLVYIRSMNAFLHFDSSKGANNSPAEKLYEAVKNYMGVGGEVPRKKTTSTQKKKKIKNKKVQPVSKPSSSEVITAGLPVFMECKTPQQSNNYDCGIYVLAIAGVIIKWFKDEDSNSDVLSVVAKDVDLSVEGTMRKEILKLVDDLRNPSSS